MQKLHLGCGSIVLEGWVNLDIDSPWADVTHDVTLGLPFPDGSVSHIFAEHIIEHIEYAEALSLLKECRRLLAPGGVVRMSTPDLTWLTLVYLSSLTTEWGDLWNPESPCMLLNEGVRAWGHRFLYDRTELHRLFRQSGFSSVIDCEWHQSSDSVLRNLESRPYHRDLLIEGRLSGVNSPHGKRSAGSFDLEGIDRLLVAQGQQLDSLRSMNSALATSVEGSVRHAASREDAFRNSQAALADRDIQIGALQLGVTDRDTHIEGLESGLRDRDSHIQGLESGLTDRDIHIQGLEAGLADRDRHIQGLESGLSDRDNHMKGLQAGLADRDTHIAGLEAGLIDRDRHILNVEVAMREQATQIEGLKSAIHSRDQSLADEASIAIEMKKRLGEGEQRVRDLEDVLSRLHSSFVGRLALRLAIKRTKTNSPGSV